MVKIEDISNNIFEKNENFQALLKQVPREKREEILKIRQDFIERTKSTGVVSVDSINDIFKRINTCLSTER